MACSPVSVPNSPMKRDIFRDNTGLRPSPSVEDIYKKSTMRRSYSDNHLSCRSTLLQATTQPSKLKSSRSFGVFPIQLSSSIFPTPIRTLLFETETENTEMKLVENFIDSDAEEGEQGKVKRTNWVQRLMELRARWKGRQGDTEEDGDGFDDEMEGGCEVDYGEQEGEERESFDRELFSRLLAKVSWSDAKRLSQLALLCNMAYVIPDIKVHDLRRHNGLWFVTSSLEKKAEAAALKAKLDKDSINMNTANSSTSESTTNDKIFSKPDNMNGITRSVAYEIAASAASHVKSQAKEKVCSTQFDGSDQQGKKERNSASHQVSKSEMAAHMAASTMTAVVAAREKEKQKVAKELQSLHSSPCEWFICDDPGTRTRFFVIQGSDSLASWQANLFFEPTKFEGTEALVHRGIYEAAKGIYEQFMPEIHNHLNAHGDAAKLQFTGHSLGGSLSLLVHLMLIARGVVKPSSLLPVVTFGSPFVFCGGERMLRDLGVDESQVHCVIMHRDIVPRAFSCHYPKQVAQVLKRLNGSFRSHPCLSKHEMLYSPLGDIFILQPRDTSSPPHPLLPLGSALYTFNNTNHATTSTALEAFLNAPHPLETLSDPTAYGSDGTILRDHDSSNYVKAMNSVLRQYTKIVIRTERMERHLVWPSVITSMAHDGSWNREGTLQRSATKEVMTRA